jgi:hypothetical protein
MLMMVVVASAVIVLKSSSLSGRDIRMKTFYEATVLFAPSGNFKFTLLVRDSMLMGIVENSSAL